MKSDLQDLLPPEALAALTEPCQTCDDTRTRKRLVALKSGSHSQLISEDVPCPDCADRMIYLNVGQWLDHTDHEPPACGHPGCEAFAPPEWVKLAETTCETCWTLGEVRATGELFYDEEDQTFVASDDWTSKPCPDCHDGKPVQTISVPCCDRQATCSDETRPGCGWAGNGTVEYRVVVTELLPVAEYKKPGHIWRAPSGAWILTPPDGALGQGITVVGEPPKPGDHIAVIKVLS